MLPDLSQVSGLQAVLLLVVPILGYYSVKYGLSKDQNQEDRRRGAAKMASTLRSYGLTVTADLLIDYSVGDYSGMGQKFAALGKLAVSGEEVVLAELEKVFDRILEIKLSTPEGVSALQKKMADNIHAAEVAKAGPKDHLVEPNN